jgi:hypothetical protein
MTHYFAIVEEEQGGAVGSGFPICPAAFPPAIRSTRPC